MWICEIRLTFLVWDVNCSISTLSAKHGQYFNNYRRSFHLRRDAEGNWSSAKIETNSGTKANTCSEKHKDYMSKYCYCLPTSPSSTVFLKFPTFACRSVEGRCCDEIQFEWIQVNYYSGKCSYASRNTRVCRGLRPVCVYIDRKESASNTDSETWFRDE